MSNEVLVIRTRVTLASTIFASRVLTLCWTIQQVLKEYLIFKYLFVLQPQAISKINK